MLARQFCEGDLLEPSQAMGGRGNQHQFVGREWLDNHGNLSRDGAHNRHVDAVLDERVDQRGTVQYIQGYLNFGKELAKLAQQAGDDIGANGGIGSHAQPARLWTAKRFHRLHGFVDDGENLVAVEKEFFTRLGQVRAAADLFKKPDAQRFFELAHLGGDGRLAEMQLFGCTYVAAVPGDRLKCSKLMQVERAHAVAYTGSSLGNTYSTGIQYVLLYVSSDRRVKLK